MHETPEPLRGRPFTRAEARSAEVSDRMLQGKRYVRIHPRVWRCADHEMSWDDEVEAARLAMPDDAHLTGITRLRLEGLDLGPRYPIRFVVARDHHIALDGIFLHRTIRLPPLDDKGVTVEAAYIAYCAQARVLDAIKVGDSLLHHAAMDLDVLRELALEQIWRDGAYEAIWLLEHLDADSRSPAESDNRSFLGFAGLPLPEVNAPWRLSSGREVVGDLVYRALELFVEHEGTHHQQERGQYVSDIGRYADLRRDQIAYVQTTKELQRRPRQLVRVVHRAMVERGYDGPAPVFGDHWRRLFLPVSTIVDRSRRPAA